MGQARQIQHVAGSRLPGQANQLLIPIRYAFAKDVHGQANAVYEAIVMRKKRDGACNILWFCKTAHGNAVDDICVGISARTLVRLVHFSFDPAGTYRIYAHAATAPFRSKCPC